MRKRSAFLPLLALLFSAIFACGMDSGKEEASEAAPESWVALKKGKSAKDFTLKDLKGEDVSLSDYKGKVVFLNFWATWCPPCRKEMPSMEKLHKKLGGREFVVLAVATDRKGEEIVKPFAEEKMLTFNILIDDKSDVSDSYGVFALPTTYIIGRDGVVLDMVQGGADWASDESIAYFEELIGKVGAT